MPIDANKINTRFRVLILVLGNGSDALMGDLRREAAMSLFGFTDSEYRTNLTGKPDVVCLPYRDPENLKSDEFIAQKQARESVGDVRSKESHFVNIFVDTRPTQSRSVKVSAWIPSGTPDSPDMKNALESAERTMRVLFSDDSEEPQEAAIAEAQEGDPHNFWIKCTHAICISGADSAENREKIKKIVGQFVFSVFK
jgi:hypothetical protein